MSRSIQIQFVKKSTRTDSQLQTRYIGGVDPVGVKWWLSESDAIAGMEDGNWRFYVSNNGHAIWLTIARTADGHKYLTAETRAVPDPLLTLPEFPH